MIKVYSWHDTNVGSQYALGDKLWFFSQYANPITRRRVLHIV